MNTRLSLAAVALSAAWLAAPAAAQQAAPAPAPAPAPEHHGMKPSKGFTQLGSLVGEWEGQTPDGKAMRLSYQLVSGGTALLEKLQMGAEPEMLTVYTPDGDRVAMTHFCSTGNQPQMQSGPITDETKQFSFGFVRATNLANAAAGHMHHLTVTLVDRDHMTQEWTWQEGSKAQPMLFKFARKA